MPNSLLLLLQAEYKAKNQSHRYIDSLVGDTAIILHTIITVHIS